MRDTLKLSAVAGILASSIAVSAAAMEPIQDEQLSEVSGQGGLSVVTALDVNIDSVEYGDAIKGTSLSFGNISLTGMGGLMLDVITGDEFVNQVIDTITGFGVDPAAIAPLVAEVALQTGYQLGSDVIQFSTPDIDPVAYPEFSKLALNASVESISTGNGGASMGSLAVNGLNPSGTTVWMFGHE